VRAFLGALNVFVYNLAATAEDREDAEVSAAFRCETPRIPGVSFLSNRVTNIRESGAPKPDA
jgi:hypothetical protein